MVAYSFKRQFVPPILALTKQQTIRRERTSRTRHARPGEPVQLYTGMRTRQCQIIGTATCADVVPVQIGLPVPDVGEWDGYVDFGPRLITGRRLDEFARLDGFPDWPAMVAFWRTEHPGVDVFSGVLIAWRDFVPALANSLTCTPMEADRG